MATEMSFVHPDGWEETAPYRPGQTVRDVAVANGIAMDINCGGALACAECHVVVDPPWDDLMPPVQSGERTRLAAEAETGPGSRLGCQIELTPDMDGLSVKLTRGYAPD
ncbi:MAG TPA: 2Fe-2S ferredoxin [Alphaproteobacteria bacterium]|nr:2Fe-2S ferredoxin [Alphaproteobacteria bacterium]